MWAVVGIAVLSIVMRIDYRTYRNDQLIWAAARRGRLDAGGGAVRAADQRHAAVVRHRRLRHPAVGAGQDGGDLVHRHDPRAADAPGSTSSRYALLPIALIVGGLAALILLEPDFGTAVSLLAVIGVMVFAAGISYRYLFGAALLALPALYVILMQADYRRRRVCCVLDPWADPLGDGFQIIQSLIAVGTGGLLGRGLMGGVQKLFYLPEPHTDFIFAVIAEETGLLGATLVRPVLLRHRLARPAHRDARARRVRRVPGARHHHDARRCRRS